MSTTYVTVAIPFVNAEPHLGYAYELFLADVHARSRRRAGDAVRLCGGTDDHSLKNVLAAEAAGRPVRDFVDQHAARFESLAGPLQLAFDDFIRTSADPRHRPAVERLWRAIDAAGDLYRRPYEGDYCVGCEQFYAEGELEGGVCAEHGTPTERVSEENWFFRLSRHQRRLEELLATDELRVRPEPFRNEVLAFVRGGLADLSVSRSAGRARGWGIPVPGDPSQVVHVWFDALTNYVSALGYGDPVSEDHRRWWVGADRRVHVIGKGILRFHAVFWPAFLLAAGQPPPTEIRVHPYLTVEGRKLSKSAGAILGPEAVVATYGADALRWWFARDVAPVADTDFSVERLVAVADGDLANALGNAVNRIVTLVHRRLGGIAPVGSGPDPAVAGLVAAVDEALADFDHRGATRLVAEAVAALNRDLEATRPWALADPGAALGRQLATARVVLDAVTPVVPALAARLRRHTGEPGGRLLPPGPLVPRLAQTAGSSR